MQVRTFVSGVNPSSVSGVQVLDDTKLATYATLATAGTLQQQSGAAWVPYDSGRVAVRTASQCRRPQRLYVI